MSIRHLKQIFHPRRIAVVGASNQPGKVGYTVFHNLITGGFPGVVYPVNDRHDAVQGVQAYASLGHLPQPIDLAIISTPAATLPGLIADCIAAGAQGAVVLAAGFREAGAEGGALERKLQTVAATAKDGFRILGPNCLGFLVPRLRLNASFAADQALEGHVAFVSQSGALCTSVLDWALSQQIGFSQFVSIGNMVDVDFADLIDYLAADEQTHSLMLYVESISRPREFMSAARAFTRRKPLVAFKSGRFAASAQAAASHTGALAGLDEVYEAAFERAGIVRVRQLNDLFDCAMLLARSRSVSGPRLAIVTNAGGPGVVASDALIEWSGQLAQLAPATIERLNALLPPHWSHANPVDILGDAAPDRYQAAVSAVLDDPGVDGLIVILTPQAMTDVAGVADALVTTSKASRRPVLACWMGGKRVASGADRLRAGGVPVYETPEDAIRAFLHLVEHRRRQEILYETPREIPIPFQLDQAELHRRAARLLGADRLTAEGDQAKELLALYEIPVARPLPAGSPAEAVEQANQVGFPVVLKIRSPQITHKTEVDGVALGLSDAGAVRAAYDRLLATAAQRRPDAHLLGVTVEPMVSSPVGVELILGAKQDPVFGPVILIGQGGVTAEISGDYALGLPPLNERLARRMLQSLRCWPLLCGFRGRPPVDLERVLEVLMRFSTLVADCPQIVEFDINPLLSTPDRVIALDARLAIDPRTVAHPPRRFAHLAIHPYPTPWMRRAETRAGRSVLLRPIKPEDEPLWHEMLAQCSQESLRYRFRHLFQQSTHQMAERFCFIDYDREMAIVVETNDPRRELLGVGRLVVNAERDAAEFAVLVVDAWQGHGLGGLLLDFTLEIAAAWGLHRVHGETTAENQRMIELFRSRGFALKQSEGDAVLASRTLEGAPAVPRQPTGGISKTGQNGLADSGSKGQNGG